MADVSRHDDAADLAHARAEELRAARLTYDASLVGRTLEEARPPAPYAGFRRARVVGHGPQAYAAACADLAAWRVQRRAGLKVRADGPTSDVGVVADLRIGVGPLGVTAPVRVVAVVGEERRTGYAYGTLPGHPEEGEEAFVLTLADDGAVRFTITAFSRPATLLARLAGPAASYAQHRTAARYLAALES